MIIINYISRQEVAVYAFYSGKSTKITDSSSSGVSVTVYRIYYLLHLVIVPSVLVHWQGGEAQL